MHFSNPGKNCCNVGCQADKGLAIRAGGGPSFAAGTIAQSDAAQGSPGKSSGHGPGKADKLEQRANASLHPGQDLNKGLEVKSATDGWYI